MVSGKYQISDLCPEPSICCGNPEFQPNLVARLLVESNPLQKRQTEELLTDGFSGLYGCLLIVSLAKVIMRFAILLTTTALLSSVWAREPADLANGRSPDGNFSVRVRQSADPHAMAAIEVVNVATKEVVGSTDTGGYARFPAVAEDGSTAVLWSPDSKHIALMTRGTKRSTSLRLYRVAPTGLAEIFLPSSTERAFEILKAKESYRCVFQRPLKWKDNVTLVVRANGDIENPTGTKIPIWYEVDVIYNIREKKITDAEVIETKPNEG